MERVINDHPAVLESAAVAVPAELTEDDVKVVVVLREGHRTSPEELLEFCQPRMAAYMLPRYVEFVDHLPKTLSGKVEKYRLRAAGVTEQTSDREAAGRRSERGR